MRIRVDEQELIQMLRDALQEKYAGDAFEVDDLEMRINSPRGHSRTVYAEAELRPVPARSGPEIVSKSA